ncbi:MAG: hypothetical protein NXI07_00970, partial [bacterium]|nr:hypothetical protein [bacterium]
MSDSHLVIPKQNIPCYQLPLSSEQLDAALQRGHGRAYLHAMQHGIPTDKLVHVLTHNLRYDKQCEDGAQDWYLAMASRDPDYERVCDDVIASACDSQSAHDRYFVAYTLELLHRQGRSDAIEALYRLTESTILDSWDTLPGAERLIELEGEKGLAHILQTIVKTGSLAQVQRWYIEHLFRQISEDAADRCENELARLSSKHPELSPLLEIVRTPYPLRKRNTDSSGQRVSLSGLSNNKL